MQFFKPESCQDSDFYDDQNQLEQFYNEQESQGEQLQQEQWNLLFTNQNISTDPRIMPQQSDSHSDQDLENLNQQQKSTINARNQSNHKKPKKKNPQYLNKPTVGNDDKKKIKEQQQQQQQQSETKNLPKFYANLILNRLENLNMTSQKKNPQIKKKITKFEKKSSKSCSLKTLREMLKDPIINKASIDLIISFDFFHQLLGSERLQDVRPPIQYLNKLYQGCFNSDALKQWKDS